MDYEPLDLSPYCNAGVEAYVPQSPDPQEVPHKQLPLGAQQFHGLPFQIGPTAAANGDPARCFLAFGQGAGLLSDPLRLPIERHATHLIFLHALLETSLWQGASPGGEVARYVFCYDDGETVEAPIRERFEVGNIPLPWGQYPFLCVPDQKDYLSERHEGRWELVGWRQTEAHQGWPIAYYLWPWVNPRPDHAIASLTVVPCAPRFVLAAITAGTQQEWPLVRSARRPLKITLSDPQRAARPFNLQIAVDRGVATYPYPLPASPLDQAQPQLPGFGAPANNQSSPAYTEVAALPSATLTVRQDGDDIAAVRWGDLQSRGAVTLPGARLELVDSAKNWVRVEIVDEQSGEPLPCRVAFHSPEGLPYPPHGHHAPLFSNMGTWHVDVGGDARLGQIAYAYVDGRCEGWLPRGRVLVDVARGYEYEPLRQWVTIEPRQQRLVLRLRRWANMNAERYFSGDTHVHFLSAQGSATEAAGEDLNVVNLLQSQWGHLFTNVEEFTGATHASPDGRTIVHVSQENRQHILGHLSLLGLKSPVMPMGSGGPSEAELGGGLDVTLSHWADACHAQGGTVVIPHLPTPNGEPAALIATGRADAVEMLEHLDYEHLEYYRYLNAGYRLPLVGGTDKMSANTPVGLYRTYAYVPPEQPFNHQNWLRALHSGNTFVSGGALLWFSVEGRPMGSTVRVDGGGTVEVTARARSIFPLHSLQIVQQGRVVAETGAREGRRDLSLHARLRVDGSSWLAARCAGPNYSATPHFDQRRRGIFAHSSPVYIQDGERYDLADRQALEYMLTMVQGSLSYIRFQSPQHDPGRVTHWHGHDDHMAFLEKPLHEARDLLHARLHRLGIAH